MQLAKTRQITKSKQKGRRPFQVNEDHCEEPQKTFQYHKELHWEREMLLITHEIPFLLLVLQHNLPLALLSKVSDRGLGYSFKHFLFECATGLLFPCMRNVRSRVT